MTNIREQFEKYQISEYSLVDLRKDLLENIYLNTHVAFAWKAYQSAHEAQQKRIERLYEGYGKYEDKITALEARCKELEDALDKINTETTCDIASSISNKSLIWQSAK